MSKIFEGLPITLQEGGDKLLAKKKTELKAYLKCLEHPDTAKLILADQTLMMLNPDDAEVKDWYRTETTGRAIVNFMLDKQNHKVDGIKWNNGEFGSRWINTMLNGKDIRLCFYSKKYDTHMWEDMPEHLKSNKFILLTALN